MRLIVALVLTGYMPLTLWRHITNAGVFAFRRSIGLLYHRRITLVDTLLARVPAGWIVTVAVPDYTVTPAGADYGDPAPRHAGIVATNAVMARLSAERGIAFVDIFDISLEAATDRSLVADDGLHPSGVQYARWVERIRPVVEGLLAP